MWPGAGEAFWSLLAPENCIIGIVCVVYLALVFLLYPEFTRDILPQVVDVYMKTGDSVGVALGYGPLFLMLALLFWLVLPRAPITPLSAVTLLASLAAIAPLVYQGKGWAYHAFPGISLGFVAVLCRIASFSAGAYNREMLLRLSICLIFVVYAAKPFFADSEAGRSFCRCDQSGIAGSADARRDRQRYRRSPSARKDDRSTLLVR